MLNHSHNNINFSELKQDSFIKTINAISKELPKAIEITKIQDDLNLIQEISQEIKSKFKKLILFGIGGSNLAGKTFYELAEKLEIKIEFVDYIDPTCLKRTFSKIDEDETAFLFISKSGKTTETLLQFSYTLQQIEKRTGFYVITENSNNPLRNAAKEIGAKIFDHDKDIGGRFSCFSIVGLLPAALSGLDVKKIRKGAENILDQFIKNDDSIIDSIKCSVACVENKTTNFVMMPYVNRLFYFNYWWAQLWAESIGKNELATTPIKAMGTIDQHSQMQLYLDGPKDKFFNIITEEENSDDVKLNNEFFNEILQNKTVKEIVDIQAKATVESLIAEGLPVRNIQIKKLDEESIGGLMMYFMLETITTCNYLNIDPFDQPAVEKIKSRVRNLMT